MPTKPRWQVVAEMLAKEAASPTPAQLAIAKKLGLTLAADTPSYVAAVELRVALSEELAVSKGYRAYAGEIDYLHSLEDELDLARSPFEPGDSRDLVSAWTSSRWAIRSARRLEEIKPELGDVLATEKGGQTVEGVLSSITADGALFFKGGRSQSCRPHQAKVVARAGDPGYATAAKKALNDAARRSTRVVHVSVERGKELDDFRVAPTVDEVAYEAFLSELESAQDERPLQKVIEQFPAILATILAHHNGFFVIPQKRLGSDFVPDFLIGGATSAGIKWVLVELESPAVDRLLTGKSSDSPAKELRKGISQIEQWREWLKGNLDYARRSRKDDGLGLPGIRDDVAGVVVIGRGEPTDDVDKFRQRTRAKLDIDIVSYDYLAREMVVKPTDESWFARFLFSD
jgi:hypothetical protein